MRSNLTTKTSTDFRYNDPDVMDKVMSFIVAIIGVGIALIIFGSFVSTVQTSITNSNLSGSAGTLAPITTIVYVAGVILAVLGSFFLLFIRRK